MIELLLVVTVLLFLAGATALRLAAPTAVFTAGTILIALGLLGGVPASIVYHGLLHRGLRAAGEVPRRWWLNPTALHARVDEAARRPMLRWFAAGVAGFTLALFGCAVVVVAAVRWSG